ncbi:hypothetical protein O181_063951 [Austropuccinia psidii MF-1]|uniref:Uncharacterized protein n=1 Tax=Austropuccinia psidii MF-1 TaxID=1389203 RepID=A0A9Q3EKZ8_9BASI|nr:hypothetical protein [Austropuccinia psidii MF-1]
MVFKCQKKNPPNLPQQDSPIPHMPGKQTLQQHTPGPSGTQWLEGLIHGKKKYLPFPILTFEVSELTLLPFVEPSQHNESPVSTPTPPIPGVIKALNYPVPSY